MHACTIIIAHACKRQLSERGTNGTLESLRFCLRLACAETFDFIRGDYFCAFDLSGGVFTGSQQVFLLHCRFFVCSGGGVC